MAQKTKKPTKKSTKTTKPKAKAKQSKASWQNSIKGEHIFAALIVLVLGYYLFFAAQPNAVTITKVDGSMVKVDIKAPYSFEEVFFEVQQLDARYLTDFRDEELAGGPILGSGSAKEYIGYLDQLEGVIAGQLEPAEEKYIMHFVEGRRNQLLSEIYFQQALQSGQDGIFRKQEDCARAEEIRESTFYYNKTRDHGAKAMAGYDQALGLKKTWDYIGVNENKPRFYSDIFIDVTQIIEINEQSLAEQCSNA